MLQCLLHAWEIELNNIDMAINFKNLLVYELVRIMTQREPALLV